MIRAIAVDDEPRALDVIALHCAKIPFVELVKTFRDPIEAIAYVEQHPPDLVFLDINMPAVSGMEVGRMLGGSIPLIFTTAYSEYAVESYEVKALDYLLKPIQFERFLRAALKARAIIEPESEAETPSRTTQQWLFVKSGARHHRVDANEILYLEKDGNYAVFHLPDRKILSRLTIRQLFEMLPEGKFLQVHKSYIVGIQHVEVVEPGGVTVGGRQIPVAKNYRSAVNALLDRKA